MQIIDISGAYRFATRIPSNLSTATTHLFTSISSLSTTAAFVTTPAGAFVGSVATGLVIAIALIALRHYYAPNEEAAAPPMEERATPTTPHRLPKSKAKGGPAPQEPISSVTPAEVYPQLEAMFGSPKGQSTPRQNTSRAHRNQMAARQARQELEQRNQIRAEIANYRQECLHTGKIPTEALIAAIRRGAITYPTALAKERMAAHDLQLRKAAIKEQAQALSLSPSWKGQSIDRGAAKRARRLSSPPSLEPTTPPASPRATRALTLEEEQTRAEVAAINSSPSRYRSRCRESGLSPQPAIADALLGGRLHYSEEGASLAQTYRLIGQDEVLAWALPGSRRDFHDEEIASRIIAGDIQPTPAAFEGLKSYYSACRAGSVDPDTLIVAEILKGDLEISTEAGERLIKKAMDCNYDETPFSTAIVRETLKSNIRI